MRDFKRGLGLRAVVGLEHYASQAEKQIHCLVLYTLVDMPPKEKGKHAIHKPPLDLFLNGMIK